MYFNPSDYHKDGEMVRTANYEQLFDLSNTGYVYTKYEAKRDQVRFFDDFFRIKDYSLIDDYSYDLLSTLNQQRIFVDEVYFDLSLS